MTGLGLWFPTQGAIEPRHGWARIVQTDAREKQPQILRFAALSQDDRACLWGCGFPLMARWNRVMNGARIVVSDRCEGKTTADPSVRCALSG